MYFSMHCANTLWNIAFITSFSAKVFKLIFWFLHFVLFLLQTAFCSTFLYYYPLYLLRRNYILLLSPSRSSANVIFTARAGRFANVKRSGTTKRRTRLTLYVASIANLARISFVQVRYLYSSVPTKLIKIRIRMIWGNVRTTPMSSHYLANFPCKTFEFLCVICSLRNIKAVQDCPRDSRYLRISAVTIFHTL